MPIVRVDIVKPKTKEYKRILLDTIHNALVNCFKIPDEDRIQRICEIEKDDYEMKGRKTDDLTIIEISAFKGRSLDAKRALYKEIVESLNKELGIDKENIIIIINEIEKENMGARGGIPISDVNLGFNINV